MEACKRGLAGQDFEETLRHETVHSVLTPPAPLNQVTTGLYQYSGLYRYGEEAAAETYGTGSLWQGLKFPITNDYVSVPRLGAELGRRRCCWQCGWVPVKVHRHYGDWAVWTFADHRGGNVRVIVDRGTGTAKAVSGLRHGDERTGSRHAGFRPL